ncbi:N-acetyl-1-D-myo-inositol-2-amino-2-deoxy-alpha-D-glucopyranoside deacetylase [Allonocardiopsis opalescens]|uniref:1D-myo-inositol 2-acetamido-2-deoxy-alpha-D-glucopyranoside deacetylase n=1 Tax=Allonocardiopsis opalescens TaxID=1144618 RepID=A0A2T0QDI5_9ACTN|nr:N-acetyl-1-D-myo-inositol-2-amino-2-deoxy-alpha-D-glucopyranoside deacetylase [Allonocardiopsis opalescens]PRY01952.1 N-acetyl-1-D-myo-inositol-2-amino-2-deoxy-alpha-D-glucopyranoside deacetylase [Allonocardiopsis opalescens]
MTDRRLLLVHAHPDDESIWTGATMARYAAEGAQVTLVTCTRGEEGEILSPELAHLAADRTDDLGRHRSVELAFACAALDVPDHELLGGAGRWRDSGMMDAPSNDDPRCFWRADIDTAAEQLVALIRDRRPQVVVTYDDNGFYGHPDHIQAHRVAWRAFEKSADPDFGTGDPWQPAKFYATAMPESVLRRELMRLRAESGPFEVVDSIADLPFGVPDDQVTTRIDAGEYLPAKIEAMQAHATQISVHGTAFALTNNIALPLMGVEYFTLIAGERGPAGVDGYEADLFGTRFPW